ncbi:hypothetical protein RHMOL_Rhmol11G0041500 [Rhododendron molle]|uniref:Uncharacterized protein n=1 Tax=Rhododendron molle TaxID=49168 RepID=A0ACC0LPK3_RHOML|nr:hypothetical protein RHMOL_Rhmol11G0041500 [Rhododendron molle]
MRKIFNALKITEYDLQVSIVACQLTDEANEWWEFILGVRRDARRVASQENEPNEENLTWAEFEELFESQYFSESYREQLRNQFERLDQELVATEDRKCRHFEKGLHPSIEKFVVGQQIGRISDIVECARSIEYTEEIPEEVKVQESSGPSLRERVSWSKTTSGLLPVSSSGAFSNRLSTFDKQKERTKTHGVGSCISYRTMSHGNVHDSGLEVEIRIEDIFVVTPLREGNHIEFT